MALNISDLPAKYQQQALEKLQKQLMKKQRRELAVDDGPPASGRAKFGNVKDQRGPRMFDSKKEARRFDQLMVMEQAGKIEDLRLQQDFTLQEAFTDPHTGERVRAIRYKADFAYWELDAQGQRVRRVVEDVKSRPTRTKEYIIKRKMMKDRLGIEVVEITEA